MGVLTAWAVAAGIQIYRDVKENHQPPLPSEFIASGAIFGVLGLLDAPTRGTAGVIAWGLLLAIVLQAGGPSKLVTGGSTLPFVNKAFPATKGAPGTPTGVGGGPGGSSHGHKPASANLTTNPTGG